MPKPPAPRIVISALERRDSRRIDVNVDCEVAAVGESWSPVVIVNMSQSGLLMRWQEFDAPSVGDSITVQIQLPANRVYGQKCIKLGGVVVRVANHNGAPRVAARISRRQIQACRETGAESNSNHTAVKTLM